MLRHEERQALHHLPFAVIALGDDGRIGFASRQAQQMLGWDDGLVGQPLSIIVPERLRGSQRGGYERFVLSQGQSQQGGVHRHPARRRDGTERPVQIDVIGFRRPDGGMFLCAVLADDGADRPLADPLEHALAAHGYRRL